MMKLYGVRGWGSGIVEVLLALAQTSYEFIDVAGFDKDGPSRERLLAVNPLAHLPTLVLDNGQVLTESAAIALMLIDRAPHLAPQRSTADRDDFYRLLIWLVANVYPTFTYGDYPERWAPSAKSELREATDVHRKHLYLWLETKVRGPYVMGESPTVLDAYLAAMTSWRPGVQWFRDHCPKITAASEQAKSMASVAAIVQLNGWVAAEG